MEGVFEEKSREFEITLSHAHVRPIPVTASEALKAPQKQIVSCSQRGKQKRAIALQAIALVRMQKSGQGKQIELSVPIRLTQTPTIFSI